MLLKIIIVLFLFQNSAVKAKKPMSFILLGNPLVNFHLCEDNEDISSEYEGGKPPGDENQYIVHVRNVPLPKNSEVVLTFDSEAKVTLLNPDVARIFSSPNIYNSSRFIIEFFAKSEYDNLKFDVKGPKTGTVPYLTSIFINGFEHCEKPQIGILDSMILGYKPEADLRLSTDESKDACGRRKVTHTELILNGLESKPGDWPWHAALYRTEKSLVKYICGGTLISATTILTAAHCVTIRGTKILPELIHVVLGKHDLFAGDSNVQEIDVHEIIVHNEFITTHLNNDIALLKLKNEAKFSDYVQPACLWHTNHQKKLPAGQDHGTVVGWGLNEEGVYSIVLKKATIPKISTVTCIKSNPSFYPNVLNDKKFCAGYTNGTSPCNGDSGGGFHTFVPYISGDGSTANDAGAWHVRGIVSLSLSRQDKPICDPSHYVVFTDIAPFREWIDKNM